MSDFFKLEKLIGEGARGYVRRVGNVSKPITFGSPSKKKKADAGGGANLAAMIARKPEVMVKITGFGKGKGVKSALDYISRDGDLELEKADGEKLTDRAQVAELAAQWKEGLRRTNAKQRDSMNLVLSMPEGTDPKRLLDASRQFAKQQFADNRDYAFALHTDEKHPHVHFVVQMKGFDGKRLDPRKEDIQAWREAFAENLREHGIEAAATPRRARGVVRKPQEQELIHMRKRGLMPNVDKRQIADAIKDLSNGAPKKPWEESIEKRQAQIKTTYATAVKTLIAEQQPESVRLARQIASFVRQMPPQITLQRQLQAKIQEQKIGGRDNEKPSFDRAANFDELDR